MPGIIPMKVIKVGNSAQTRIAQACDRCRSKKIRCDGFHPSCTQCSQVGFECKTSDKLSRRAFPRGYTESLEERVRSLEGEVKELKDLLDAKDEKIDMLSRMRSNSPSVNFASRRSSSIKSPNSSMGRLENVPASPVETFRVMQPQSLNEREFTESSYYSGTSSSRAFADALRLRIEGSGRSSPSCQPESLFPTNRGTLTQPLRPSTSGFWKAPPRMTSDQMVNVYFQEWAPLFPVLHKPTFLVLYEQYVSDASTVQDCRDLAQLHLVFGIAAISSNSRIHYDADACERQWMTSLNSFITETSLTSLQCLILAQIYCVQKGDYDKLLYYKSLAAGVCFRLGLHQSQQRYGLGSLTTETRKRVFWSFYTLDCFSAAMLGLPKSLKEFDISCEYPVDVDDEYITERGFQPTLPGESTKVSSALALFRGARVLSNVLDLNYPAAVSHEISLTQINTLDEELGNWFQHLPPHLKLSFEQERPSTNIISSRCPLLSFMYHFTRVLIHRPAICAVNSPASSSSMVILASSCKHMVQIIQLLDERSLSFSHCLNRSEVLLLTGLGLLFQSVELGKDSKLLKDNQRTVCSVIELLEKSCAPGFQDFKTIGCSMLSIRRLNTNTEKRSESASSKKPVAASPMLGINAQEISHRRRASTTKLPDPKPAMMQTTESKEAEILRQAQKLQQNNMRNRQMLASAAHRHTISTVDLHRFPVLTPGGSIPTGDLSTALRAPSTPSSNMNLDYFSFTSNRNSPAGRTPNMSHHVAEGDWDHLLGSPAAERASLGMAVPLPAPEDSQNWSPMQEVINSPLDKALKSKAFDSAVSWSPDAWNLPSEGAVLPDKTARGRDRTGPQSVLSLSDESMTSGEDFSSIDFGSLEGEEMFKAFMQVEAGDEKADSTA